jgi:hypothetical protein
MVFLAAVCFCVGVMCLFVLRWLARTWPEADAESACPPND